ncbi:MAG: GAF domain-containing protein [Acidobacteriota bacterium]|nr:GAF domain-containing protein [Acidobacteriota bacterium]MDE3190880.1 GAF domain-containing protein [Acidobacteriota bacterium]
MVARPEARRLDLIPGPGVEGGAPRLEIVESYRRLADVFHEVLAEQSLDALLERIADTLADLVPHESMTIYEADEAQGILEPVLARDDWAEQVMQKRVRFDEGVTGWAARRREPVLANQAHLDPRVRTIPGTPLEPEALISIPLVARAQIKGVFNLYRSGPDVEFSDDEFELAKRFADAAALALDNAQIRARLEHQAQTDSLTGAFNHRSFHERLLAALQEVSRTHRPVAVLMLDIDDFKRVNDVHGHGVGDELLKLLAETVRSAVRPEDAVCRLGGEEFGVIMGACDGTDANRVAERIVERLGDLDPPAIGKVTVSVGLALGPEHAMNPRELAACAEAAMMTAKAQGKNRVVLYDEGSTERPDMPAPVRDVRSLAHMKMLQSLTGKLNRLTDVRKIGDEITSELRSLIDYHNCRVFVVDGDVLVPVAFRGALGAHTGALPLELLRIRMGVGVTGQCAERGESLLIGDAANCEFGHRIEGTPVIEESLVAVPLRYGSRVAGVIVVSKLGRDQFDEDDVRLLEVLAGHAAVAVENARLYDSARREAESATALLEFSRELASSSSLDHILQRVVELTCALLGSPRTSIWLEDESGWVVPRALHGHTPEEREKASARRYDARSAGRLTGEPFILTADQIGALVDDQLDPVSSYAIAPLDIEGRAAFIVAALPADEGHYGEREMRLLGGLAHQTKLAVENASNYEGLERTFVSTVEALANALEANDEYTSTHARWISDLSLRVGRELGLGDAVLKRLELGALLHDIGKIGVPGTILSKPGRLNSTERAVIEMHPVLGERIIAPIDRLEEVCGIVRHCHERWDGRGYPDGLAGEDIPLEARIIFVCDAYHAMTTDRPYRRRLSHPEAVRRLRDGAGSQFDPRVVDVCLGVVERDRAHPGAA